MEINPRARKSEDFSTQKSLASSEAYRSVYETELKSKRKLGWYLIIIVIAALSFGLYSSLEVTHKGSSELESVLMATQASLKAATEANAKLIAELNDQRKTNSDLKPLADEFRAACERYPYISKLCPNGKKRWLDNEQLAPQ